MVALLVPGVARAEPPEIEAMYHDAFELRTRGEDAQALPILRAVEARAPSGRSIAQVGLAEQATGAWVAAERDIDASFQRGGEWVARNRAALEGSLTTVRRHLGTLELRCDACARTRGSSVRIDGVDQGAVPLGRGVRLEIGRHRVEVRAPGYVDVARDVEIEPAGLARESITLVRSGAATPGEAEPGAGGSDPITRDHASSEEPPSRAPRILGWTALGLGVASTGVAVAFGLLSNGAANDYNEDTTCGAPAKNDRCTSLRDDVTRDRTLAIATGITGAALLGAGATLLVLSSSGSSSRPSASSPPTPSAAAGLPNARRRVAQLAAPRVAIAPHGVILTVPLD